MDTKPSSLCREVGQRIRRLRRAQQLTAEALAARLNWPKDTLINYEYGRRAVTLDRLEAIAAALGVSPLALLIDDERVATLVTRLAEDTSLIDHVTFFLESLQAELEGNG